MQVPAAYHLEKIQHDYGNHIVLDIDTLDISKGSITGLIGPNGSGKSTLLKLLAFALQPRQGNIYYNGKKEDCFSPSVRSKVTLLTQTPYLLKRTVFDNIIYGLKIRKDTRNLETRVKKALANVGLDYGAFALRKWHQLSGGEAQRVAMAARLILKPEVLLLDEPVASVDVKSAKLIRQASLDARDLWGTTLVVASHDLQWLYSVSDTQLSILNGKIYNTGVENIIAGPFETNSDNQVIKPLKNGQAIKLKQNPKGRTTALIKNNCLRVETQQKSADRPPVNTLNGQVNFLMLGEKIGYILTGIAVQDLSFTLKMTPEQVSGLGLYPGKKVSLSFDPDDIEWL